MPYKLVVLQLSFVTILCISIWFLISVPTESSTWLETFLLGWLVTIVSGITAYPLDTIKRRMMMTAGQAVKYESSWACFRKVIRMEGCRALFRGAGVNVIRGVLGAGVLSGFDRLKKVYIIRRDVMWERVSDILPDWSDNNQIMNSICDDLYPIFYLLGISLLNKDYSNSYENNIEEWSGNIQIQLK